MTVAASIAQVDELAEWAFERDDERAQDLLSALTDYAQLIAPDAK